MIHPSDIRESSLNSVESASTIPKDSELSKLPIRERLRRWEAEHLAGVQSISLDPDHAGSGQVSNALTRPFEGDEIQESDMGDQLDELPFPLFEADDLVGFGNQRSHLVPGDLVELRLVMDHAQFRSE